MTDARPIPVAVLGGSSVSTPVLMEELGRAWARGELPSLELRLHGRAAERLRGVLRYGRARLADLLSGDLEPDSEADLPPAPTFRASNDLEETLEGAALVLCQVRPGGFQGRAGDEALALRHGVPGDEGLGPSGLACFLRGLSTMDSLHAAIARHAPRAVVLHMTSPLGLTVARARRLHGLRCYGICELPALTARRVVDALGPRLGCTELEVDHAGTHHQCWLHRFRDARGADRTTELLRAIDDPELVRVAPERIRREGAVPLPYLRLYYHTERELRAQRAARTGRGRWLGDWAARLERAYVARPEPDRGRIDALLGMRRLDWYRAGVVPAIAAFLGRRERRISLDLPGGGALPGVDPEAVVELPCRVREGRVSAAPVPPLPPGPAALHRRILEFERLAHACADAPTRGALETCLAAHPLVPDAGVAARLAAEIL